MDNSIHYAMLTSSSRNLMFTFMDLTSYLCILSLNREREAAKFCLFVCNWGVM